MGDSEKKLRSLLAFFISESFTQSSAIVFARIQLLFMVNGFAPLAVSDAMVLLRTFLESSLFVPISTENSRRHWSDVRARGRR